MTVEIDSTDNTVISEQVDIDGRTIYLSMRSDASAAGPADEAEISSRRLSLNAALDDLSAFATTLATRLRTNDATKVAVEFGCEFVLESGTIFAAIGKAGSKSAFKIVLEWESRG